MTEFAFLGELLKYIKQESDVHWNWIFCISWSWPVHTICRL